MPGILVAGEEELPGAMEGGEVVFPAGAEVFDITAPFSPNVPSWPTHPPIAVEPLHRIAEGADSNVSQLRITSHAGTHVDAIWHYVDSGAKLLEIPLQRWNGPCYVARIPDEVAQIGVAELEAARIPAGTTRLLLHTRNSRAWERWNGETPIPFDEGYAGVLPDAARWMVDFGIELVGTDAPSIGTYGPLKLAIGDGAPARVLLVREP